MHWDAFTTSFVAAGGVLVLAALVGTKWFGPGWAVVAGIGLMLVLAGVAMAFERKPR